MTYIDHVFLGSCENMSGIPDGVVHTCVTSPPYYGLRDYGTARWEGGDLECDHRSDTMQDGRNEDRPMLDGSPATNSAQIIRFANVPCGKCGAIRIDEQIGLEPTVQDYVERLVRVFREVRRVLRDDGTAWLNLGDGYATAPRGNPGDYSKSGLHGGKISAQYQRTLQSGHEGSGATDKIRASGLKAKDLIGVPWQVAFALRADGWWLRDAIVWHKPAVMPQSVDDRCTPSYEMVFMLTKKPRYYADMASVRTPVGEAMLNARVVEDREYQHDSETRMGKRSANRIWSDPEAQQRIAEQGANLRNVWTIATKPYDGAHFATFPIELPSRCIRIGSPEGGLVLDPFMGSGTTAEAAEALGRHWVGYEINPEYHALIEERTRQRNLFKGGAA